MYKGPDLIAYVPNHYFLFSRLHTPTVINLLTASAIMLQKVVGCGGYGNVCVMHCLHRLPRMPVCWLGGRVRKQEWMGILSSHSYLSRNVFIFLAYRRWNMSGNFNEITWKWKICKSICCFFAFLSNFAHFAKFDPFFWVNRVSLPSRSYPHPVSRLVRVNSILSDDMQLRQIFNVWVWVILSVIRDLHCCSRDINFSALHAQHLVNHMHFDV